MARRATAIKEAKSSSQYALVVDAGNSLTNEYTTTAEVAAVNGGRTATQVLNRLGYDAVALGELDLHMGRASLLKRIAEAKSFSFVSANVIDKTTGKLLVQPYVVKELAGHRVALIGITGPTKSVTDLTIVPALDAATEYVQKAQAEADIVVLLSNAGAKANQEIAAKVPGVDVIISGGQDDLPAPAQPRPDAVVVQADLSSSGDAGRYLGTLVATFDASGKLTRQQWKNTQLSAAIADDADTAAWVATLPKPATAATPTPAQ